MGGRRPLNFPGRWTSPNPPPPITRHAHVSRPYLKQHKEIQIAIRRHLLVLSFQGVLYFFLILHSFFTQTIIIIRNKTKQKIIYNEHWYYIFFKLYKLFFGTIKISELERNYIHHAVYCYSPIERLDIHTPVLF